MIQVQHYTEEFAKELLPLLRKDWQESPSYEPDLEVDPNFDIYAKLDAAGALLCLTLRDATRLVGFLVYIVSPSTHHKSVMVGRGDVMYIEPGYRGHAKEMLWAAEQLLKAGGVRRLGWATHASSRLYKLLHATGFYDDEIVMEKKL